MKSRTTKKFRKAFAQLPKPVQKQARIAYRQFKKNSNHPSLGFKKVHLRHCDLVSHQLWIEAGKYVATFPNISISCGNTTMNKEEWLSYLTQFDNK